MYDNDDYGDQVADYYEVYSKPACPFCDRAKALLDSTGHEYRETILDVGQPKLDGRTYITRDVLLERFPTARTMPQIGFNDGHGGFAYIGGFNELKKKLQETMPLAA